MKTLEICKDIQEIVNKHGNNREALMPVLQEVVEKKKYLTKELVIDVAKAMNLSPNEVYSVATFYSFLSVQPKGKFVVRVCKTISCDMAGKDEIIKAIERELNVKLGETTQDNNFTLETTNCIGMCDQGPAMLINDDVYTKLDPNKAVEIIRKYKN